MFPKLANRYTFGGSFAIVAVSRRRVVCCVAPAASLRGLLPGEFPS
jgi:hypothetical protein